MADFDTGFAGSRRFVDRVDADLDRDPVDRPSFPVASQERQVQAAESPVVGAETAAGGDIVAATPIPAAASLTLAGGVYTQNFNTLVTAGTSSTLPADWVLAETGAFSNSTYTASTGSDTPGDTYSFGALNTADRALGSIRSGSLIPTFGVSFTNNTGGTITALNIAYTGEQWRLGATGRQDRLDFQYSTTATSLVTGTYTDFNALDFLAPQTTGTVGALDGNASANRTALTATIAGLSIAPGATFWLRWNDPDVPGGDDGLAVDDFSLSFTLAPNPAPSLTALAPTLAVLENAGQALLDSDVTFADANGNFSGGSVTVTGLLAEDEVAIRNQGTGAGQIGVSGSNVSYGGVIIGTVAGGSGATLTVTLNASATAVAVDALIQNLTYINSSEAPTATRTLTVNVADGQGAETATFAALTLAAPLAGVDVGLRSAPAFGDYNGDGRVDLLVGGEDGFVRVFQRQADGSFVAQTGAANPFTFIDFGTLATPALTDFTGDGRVDVLVGSSLTAFRAFAGDGLGGFTELTGGANPFAAIVEDGANPTFTDFDGDGDQDLVVGRFNGDFLAFRNTGNVFTQLTGTANPFNGLSFDTHSTPSFVDIDRDGDLDLVTGGFTGTFAVFRNEGVGQPFVAVTGAANPLNGFTVPQDTGAGFSWPAFADLNGDGLPDLLSGNINGNLFAYRNIAGAEQVVTVTAVSDAPSGTDATLTINEDTARPLAAADFGFSDIDGHGLIAVVITTLPAAGILTLSGVAVTAGQAISSFNINSGNLVFTPATNANGVGAASFTFQVRDNGGTADGGVDTDPSPNTLTFDVTAQNDAPTVTIVPAVAGFAKSGGEMLVNTATAGSQTLAQITVLSNGGFVVTWTDGSVGVGGATGDPSSTAVKAQIYTAGGAPVGGEILVNTATENSQTTPQITALSNGGFVVTWTDNSFGVGGATGDASGTALKAQVYAAGGAPVGGEILVNTATIGNQTVPQIKALSNGGFVVTWQDNSQGFGGATGDASGTAVKAQVYSAGGAPAGGEILVNTATASDQSVPQITALSGGGFVVTWADFSAGVGGATGDAGGSAIKAQVYAAGGAPVGGEIRVNTATAGSQTVPQITALSNGGFAVTWQDGSAGVGGATGDASGNGIKAQVYSATGAPAGGEILVNTATLNNQSVPQITALSNGGFVVTWTDLSAGAGGATGDASGTAVKAQVYSAGGAPVGGEIRVNTATASNQSVPQITALPNGGFVVTWTDSSAGVGGATGDASGNAVKAQVYSATGTPVGGEMLVNTATAGVQNAPQIKALSNGSFVVTWQDSSGGVGGATGDESLVAIKAQIFAPQAGTLAATEQTALSLKGAVTVADVDVGAGTLIATLAVGYGVLNVTVGTSGATISSGNGTGSVVVSGTVAQLNALLQTDATSTLTYTADTDAPPASTTLSISVNDNGNTGAGAMALTGSDSETITIAAVNDAPAGTDATLTTDEDTARTLAAADFGYSDPGEGNAFAGVVLTTLPASGTLSLNGVAITVAGTFVTAAQMGANQLVYTAADNPSGASSFTFQVRDDGGTANGGVDTDQSANTLTFDVTAVNDAPTAAIVPPGGGFAMSGGEILVNTATASDQFAPRITALSNGGFVVTWTDNSAGVGGATGDNSFQAIKVQIYAAGGAPVGGEIRVNTATANDQNAQQITALSNGGFVVTWTDFSLGSGGATGDTSSLAVKAQIYAAGGAPVGGEIRVNTATANNQSGQQITALSNGGFVVTWQDSSLGVGGATGDASGTAVKAQVYAAGGAPVGGEILVNTATASNQGGQQITALSNGGFVVTWQDASLGVGGATGDTSNTAVKAQVYGASGAPVGGEIRVNTATANIQDAPQITALSNGGFVVTWRDFSVGAGGATGDASGTAVKAQVYAAGGAPVGGEIRVNTATAANQDQQQITALSNGGFVVTWTDNSAGVGGTTGDANFSAIKAQVYAAGGAPVGGEIRVNTATVGSQFAQQITALSNGGFVVTWTDNSLGVGGAAGDDGGFAVKAQAFTATGAPVGGEILVNTATAADQNTQQITALSNGGFVVTWRDGSAGVGGATGDNSGFGVKAQIFAPFAGTLTATEQTALSIKGVVTVSDVDAGAGIVTATVSVGYGILDLSVGTSGATIASGNGTGSVVVSGTIAQINALLTSDATSTLTYTADTDTPPGATTLTVSVDDGGNTGSGGALTGSDSETINIIAQNDAPSGADASDAVLDNVVLTFTASDFSTGFADPDGNAFAGVRITTLPATGTLKLTGVAITAGADVTLAQLDAGNLTYEPAAGSGGTTPTFTFQVRDNGGTANGGVDLDQSANTFTISVGLSNFAPVLDLDGTAAGTGTTASLQEQDIVIVAPDATLSDPDSANFDGGSLTVGYGAGANPSDSVFISDEGGVFSGGGRIGVSSNNVYYNTVVIGTISSAGLGLPLVLTFNANATPVAVQRLVQRINTINLSDTPPAGSRPLTFTVTDGDGGSSSAVADVTITAQNDAPTIANLDGDTGTIRQDVSVFTLLDAGQDAIVTDPDSGNFNGGVLTATITSGFDAARDQLGIFNDGVVSTGFGRVLVNGVDIGAFTASPGSPTLTITFDNDDATPARVQAVVQRLFLNATATPSEGVRQLGISLTDGDGGASSSANGTVNVFDNSEAITFDPATGPVSTDTGGGADSVTVINSPGQVRLTFLSAGVGNGNPNDPAPADGGLNVRLQAEGAMDTLTGPVSRFDDEGITFIASAGQTFDVRDTGGAQRGDQFEVVTLGTSGDDIQTAVQAARPYYFNGGMGNDTITGGTANDFLVGGAGNDTLDGGGGVQVSTTNLLTNGSFEQRDATTTSRDYTLAAPRTDFNGGEPAYRVSGQLLGWTITGPGGEVEFNTDNPNNPSNAFTTADGLVVLDMETDPGEDMAIAQDVAGLTAGSGYRIQLSAALGIGPGNSASLQVLWNGSVVGTVSPTSTTFSDFSFDVIAISGTNQLTLREVGGNGGDGRGTALDNVRLFAVTAVNTGNDSFIGGAGSDMITGGDGNDVVLYNVTTDGADTVNLGDGSDVVNVSGAAGQVRLTFRSSGVGNGFATDPITGAAMSDGDGLNNVRVQAEDGNDGLTNGIVSRYDDEGTTFIAAAGQTFDVRDISGTQRGDLFEVVVLGTSGDDIQAAVQAARPYYFNGGLGNDTITGGTANDFLVGGAGNDILSGGDGNDDFIGGTGNDQIDGGANLDTARYAGNRADYVVTAITDGNGVVTGYTVQDTNPANGDDGTDTLTNVERLIFADASVGLDGAIVGDGGNNSLDGTPQDDFFDVRQGGDDNLRGFEGNDGFYFGAAYTQTDVVDGGEGNLDTVGLQGDYNAGVTLGSLVGVELVALLPGNDNRFGGGPGTSFNYVITADAGTIVSNNRLTIQANTLRATESFTFDGTTSAINFLIFGGAGTDSLTGGSGNDGFFFGQARFNPTDIVNGGAGTMDQLGLQGNYGGANAVTFGAAQLSGLEFVVLLSASDNRFGASGGTVDYDITINNGNVAPGAEMIISANTLRAGETLEFDGAAETDGTFRIFSGAGDDTLIGGQGNDEIVAGAGNDRVTGNGGNDMLNGGDGTDTAVFAGPSSGYAFTTTFGADGRITGFSSTVADTNSSNGDEGTDTLTGIEALQFADGTLTVGQPVLLYNGSTLIGTFGTIQDAVDAAGDGNTIVLTAGTYVEQVVVSGIDNLTIRPFPGADVTIQAPADLVFSAIDLADYDINAVLSVLDSTGFVLENVTVDGAGAGNSVDEGPGANPADFVGVFLRDTAGTLTNVDVIGVRDAYAGGTTVGGNPVISGNQRGQGILVDNAAPLAFTMTGGSVVDFQKTGILLYGTIANITGVTVAGGGAQTINAQNGIQVFGTSGTIAGNTITGIGYAGTQDVYSGAVLGFGNTNLNITGNTITGANGETADAKVIGVYVLDFGGTPNSGGAISGNIISFVDEGIDVTGVITPDTIAIANNTITNVDPTDQYSYGIFFSPDPSSPAAFNITGTSFSDVLNGASLADTFNGAGGDDELAGNGGNDQLDGGANFDTASFAGPRSGYTVTVANGVTTVTDIDPLDGNNDGSDTLTNIEGLSFDGAVIDQARPVQLTDANGLVMGSFTTIQAAVNAARNGDTITVAAGTYVEQVVVSGVDNLTIRGAAGATVVIQAPADVVETARSSSDREIHAVLTAQDSLNLTLQNIDIDGAGRGNTVDEGGGAGTANFYGIFYRNASGSLFDVDITGVRDPYPGGTAAGGQPLVSGTQRGVGLVVDNDNLLPFSMIGGSITDFQKNATSFNRADLNIAGVTVTGGGAQTINAQNGIQVANSTGSISANTISGIGYAGPADAYSGAILAFGNTNLTIAGNSITGANNDSPDAKVVGIYVLDFGTPNSGGSISGNAISFVDEGIDVTGAFSPDAIAIGVNTITDVDPDDQYSAGIYFEPDAATTVAFTVEGSALNDFLSGAAGADTLNGNGGPDVLNGKGGNDHLNGDAGSDTAVYAGTRAGYAVTQIVDPDTGLVTGFSQVADDNAMNGDEGTDALTSIEALEFADVTLDTSQAVQLFDAGNQLVGTFDTIQAAVDAAQSGATILIAGGTYVEQVSIANKSNLTLRAADGATVIVRAPADLTQSVVDTYGDDVRSVITVTGSTGITLQDLDVDGGFAGDTTPGSNDDELSGVTYLDSTGLIDGLDIYNVGNSPAGGLFGLQHGVGLYLNGDGVAGLDAVTVTGTIVRDFQKTGVFIAGIDLTFAGNTVTGIGATELTGQNGVQVARSQGSIANNTITALGYVGPDVYAAGIIAYEPTGALAITGNTFVGTGATGTGAGIDLSDTDGQLVTISGNSFGALDYGIYAYTFTGGTLGLDSAPVLSGNSFTNIELEALHIAPEESFGDPFTTANPFNLAGTAFADTLAGSSGADTLNGAGGADRLTGNGGADQLTGGSGSDSFNYLRASDSTNLSRDQILDFATGDVIDLSGLAANNGLGSFQFIGNGPQTGARQLQVVQNGNDATVNVFINDDAVADLVIGVTVVDGHALTIGDFNGASVNNDGAAIMLFDKEGDADFDFGGLSSHGGSQGGPAILPVSAMFERDLADDEPALGIVAVAAALPGFAENGSWSRGDWAEAFRPEPEPYAAIVVASDLML